MSMGDDRSICIFGPKSGIISLTGQFVTLSELDEEAKGVQEKQNISRSVIFALN